MPDEIIPGETLPAFCLTPQGRKVLAVGGQQIPIQPGEMVFYRVRLPVVARVVQATPERPCLAALLLLEPALITDVAAEGGISLTPAPRASGGIAVAPLDPAVVDPITRLLRLLDAPRDVAVLGPLIVREIVYRLLVGPQGDCLREIARTAGDAPRVARAIEILHREFDRPLRMVDLAREAGLSLSTLHRQFKAVTSVSPLQFQKQLRLQEARRLMLAGAADAATAAVRVGYESPSQFGREYRRLFGAPPASDVSRLRERD